MTMMARGRKGHQGKMGGIWPLLCGWWQKPGGGGSTRGKARGVAWQGQGGRSMLLIAAVNKKGKDDNKKEAAGCHHLHIQ